MAEDFVLLGEEARESLIRGALKLSRAVGVTLGPRGQLAVIDDGHAVPHLTKDGVTVAKAIKLADPAEMMGCEIVRTAARRTAEQAGDGTTTATVLAGAIIDAGASYLRANRVSRDFFRAIDDAGLVVHQVIESRTREVNDPALLQRIATVSANQDEQLGELVAGSFSDSPSPEDVILIERSQTQETWVERSEGCQIDRGFVSPGFATDRTRVVSTFDDPSVIVIDRKLNSVREIVPLLEKLRQVGKPIFLVAHDYSDEVVDGLLVNFMKGLLRICCIKGPEFGLARSQSMEDLATVLGCRPITQAEFGPEGLGEVGDEFIGSCRRVECHRDTTVFVGPAGSEAEIETRRQAIVDLLGQPNRSEEERKVLARRVRRLASGVSIIRVGGVTEVDLLERLDRVEDAVSAVKSALQAGVVSGGGTTLLHAAWALRDAVKNGDVGQELVSQADYVAGLNVVSQALQEPFLRICRNANTAADLLAHRFAERFEAEERRLVSYDAVTDEFRTNDDRILDPAGVVMAAYDNAVGVSRSVLSVGCVIVNEIDG
jgi:chaperonin GroEL